MTPTRPIRPLLALATVAVLSLAAGCGSDSSGETGTPAQTTNQVSIPSVTSPNPTTSTPSTTTAGGKKGIRQTTTTASGGSSTTCTVPDAFQDFKFSGLDCSSAVAVAQAWDQNGKRCNTVDNPESPIGPQRTCSVNGYSCTAKRDIHSDARFVTCTQGSASVRFTWLPA
jgi:hypothetical protein